ncbi:lplA [Symbiodinium sp. CCMP2592]|nr:lplA [Symbiodinium sp. CCMP2592]
MHNHSWSNRSCDAHGICWKCLNRFVEVQILEEGRFNIKCPGIGCNYRLLPLDVERALEASEPERQQVALKRYSSMRSGSHGQRLREVVLGSAGPSERWLLEECQACPQCLSLVRREDGCLHVFCRCGCDFCAGCGSPKRCLCSQLEKDRDILFAAWLRIAPESPAAWLRDLRCDRPEEHLLTSLGFFLWMAYLPVDLPWTRALEEPEHSLPPVRWRSSHWEGISEDEDWAFDLEPAHVFRHPLSSWCNLVDGDEEENCFQDYQRAPRRPWRPFASQRSSRRQDRHHYTPLRWKDVRPWTGEDAAAPLRRRRQPRAVATGARSAEHAAAAARKVLAQHKRRQEMRRHFRDSLECEFL